MTSATEPSPKSGLIGQLETFLSELILDMSPAPASEHTQGRPPILPAMALWAGLLVCILRGFSSQLALWRLLTEKGFWHFPRAAITDQAVYNRLGRSGTAPLEAFLAKVTSALEERLAIYDNGKAKLAPFAKGAVALDCSTLEQVARKLPSLRGIPKADSRLLAGKLETIFDLRRQLWRTVRFAPASQNEKQDARTLIATIPKGYLILADLGYFGFSWFDWLTENGYWWVSRLREKTSYQLIHSYYSEGTTFDGLVWLGAYRADQAAHAVRMVTFQARGQTYRYITNVCNPQQLSPLMLAQLYARRWDIEMAFQLIKQHLGLHLLWSAKSTVIQQQVLAVLIISQVLQAMRLEIAWRAGADPFEVSLPLFIQYAPYYASEGQDPVEVFVERGRELGFIRPSRRTVIRAPELPSSWQPLPADIILVRTPRYAQRRC